jgi:hypothetical protein
VFHPRDGIYVILGAKVEVISRLTRTNHNIRESESDDSSVGEDIVCNNDNDNTNKQVGMPIKKKRKIWKPKTKPSNVSTKISGGKFHLKRPEENPTHVNGSKAAKTTSKIESDLRKND